MRSKQKTFHLEGPQARCHSLLGRHVITGAIGGKRELESHGMGDVSHKDRLLFLHKRHPIDSMSWRVAAPLLGTKPAREHFPILKGMDP